MNHPICQQLGHEQIGNEVKEDGMIFWKTYCPICGHIFATRLIRILPKKESEDTGGGAVW